MQSLYQAFASKANKNDEQAWMVGRVVLIVAVFVGNALFMRGTSAELALYVCGGFVFLYNLPLYWLLRRGQVTHSFAIGFILDNGTLLVGWWICVASLAGEKQTNDLYLILAPMLIIGVARLGWKSGVAFTAAWLTWMGVTHYVHYGPGSYDVEQMPLRLAFMGAGSIIAGRLVARLDSEKRQALELRSESDMIAEIGRLAGSTMDLSRVFDPIARSVGRLVPYRGLSVAEVDPGKGTLSIVVSAGRRLGIWVEGQANPIVPELIEELVMGKAPISLDASACQNLLEQYKLGKNQPLEPMRSIIIAPAMANDSLIALLVAWSDTEAQFNDDHQRILGRIASHLSGAIANARLYQRSLELNKVQETSAAKSSLLSAVSHELKTPLTSMIAFTDILLRDRQQTLTDKQIRHLSVLRRSEDTLVGLVDDLLDASRVESGRLELDLSPVFIRDLVREVVEGLRPLIDDRSQSISLKFIGDPPAIQADSRRLSQVMRNLVSNAIKYSPDGSEIHVSIESTDSEGLSISVKDNGIGMSEEDIGGLFSPFFRSGSAEARKQPGTGLGLVITKGIVEAHGGQVSIASLLGHGTTVTVSLPAKSGLSDSVRAA